MARRQRSFGPCPVVSRLGSRSTRLVAFDVSGVLDRTPRGVTQREVAEQPVLAGPTLGDTVLRETAADLVDLLVGLDPGEDPKLTVGCSRALTDRGGHDIGVGHRSLAWSNSYAVFTFPSVAERFRRSGREEPGCSAA